MKKWIILFACCLAVSAGDGVHEAFEADWVPIAEQVWQKQNGNTIEHFAEGPAGMGWALERAVLKMDEAEANFLRTGEGFWLDRMQDLENRINRLENKLPLLTYDICHDYQNQHANLPGNLLCTPMLLNGHGEALAYAGHVPGGGVETEAHVTGMVDHPSEVTLICSTFANGTGSNVYVHEPSYVGVGFTCFDLRYGTANCSAYAYAESITPMGYWEMESGVSDCFFVPQPSCSISGPTQVVGNGPQALNYSVTLTNLPVGYSIEWSVDNLPVLGATGTTYTHFIGSTSSFYTQTIAVTVKDSSGAVVTSCTLTLSVSPPLDPGDVPGEVP